MSERVLIVDDDITVRMIARTHLEAAGFAVEELEDGVAALETARALRPVAVILDVMMPGKDGFTVCSELRAQPEFRDTPILMMTGLEDAASIERAYQVGATQFTTKPVNWVNEIFRLRFMIRAARAAQDLEQSKAELARAKEDLEMTFASIEDVILLLDTGMRIRRANRAAGHAGGVDVSAIVGQDYRQVFPGLVVQGRESAADRAKRSGAPVVEELADGIQKGRIHVVTVWPIMDVGAGMQGLVIVARDVTDHKALERDYLHAQKLEAVGGLAAGVAHDFNNLLQAIGGYAELMAGERDLSEVMKEGVTEIRATTQRGRELTKQMLAASRKVESQKKPVHIGNAIRELEKLFKRSVPKDVEINVAVKDENCVAELDPSQFDQILMNLVVNAGHAMPQGGRLNITIGAAMLGDEQHRNHPSARTGRHVIIEVTDTGCGMSPSVLKRIFEPFFTTKAPGKGTGLGLSVVYNIVKNHSGQITVDSVEGKGTTFRLFFPATEMTTAAKTEKVLGVVPDGKGQTILVVDDEPTLRRLAERMLKKRGYDVMTAENGEQALQLFMQNQHRVALVLMDLNMPVMGGQESMERMKAFDSRARIVIATGMVETSEQESLLKAKSASILAKPYDETSLLRAVHEALPQAAAPHPEAGV